MQLLIVTSLIAVIRTQTTLVPVSQLDQTKVSIQTRYSQVENCICNLVSDLCDEFCCCDPLCKAYEPTWESNKKCTERTYPDQYQIPDCREKTIPNFLDLFQGFRIAYNILKSLGCVYFKNLDQSLLFFDATNSSSTSQQQYLSSLAQSIIQDPVQTSTQSKTSRNAPQLTLKLRRKQQANINYGYTCQEETAIFGQIYPAVECIEEYDSYDEFQQNIEKFKLSYYLQEFKYNSDAITPKVNQIYVTNDQFEFDQTKTIIESAVQTTCQIISTTEQKCQNLVYEASYTIKLDISGKMTESLVDFIVIDSYTFKNTESTKVQVPQVVSVMYEKTNTTIFQHSSNPGYLIGSVINFATGKEVTFTDKTTQRSRQVVQLSMLRQPLRLSMADESGDCLYNQKGSIRHTLQIEFLKNSQLSCIDHQQLITAENYCTAPFYNNFLENLQYIAIYGNSNPAYLSDWVKIQTRTYSANSKCPQTLMFPLLRIYYSSYGLKTKERFRINRATIDFVEQYIISNHHKEYFQYKPSLRYPTLTNISKPHHLRQFLIYRMMCFIRFMWQQGDTLL